MSQSEIEQQVTRILDSLVYPPNGEILGRQLLAHLRPETAAAVMRALVQLSWDWSEFVGEFQHNLAHHPEVWITELKHIEPDEKLRAGLVMLREIKAVMAALGWELPPETVEKEERVLLLCEQELERRGFGNQVPLRLL
ncbi:hypothetical protein [Mesorhizobium ciceri]|uniref:Uncharacterized protein n=1 Tax=Mesorhizobium ciceri biovar biserrulae (strain HAMBI 2942 / LMG 23838 / WSM1271) TaxID=765698 RepID=E8T7W2_MESCW|nr:hypothetical protein [Mesorhizobium ciceri]ADV12963.1 hypothetical protein Mesci_3846 [Mesorhizobium ciceri biovar biserrulae WSM1271]